MPNQIYSATLVVTVNGSKLGADLASQLSFAMVETARSVPGMFELHFSDSDRLAITVGAFTVGAEVALAVDTNEGRALPLLKGEIATLETEIGPSGAMTIVRGYEPCYRFLRTHTVTAFQQVKVSDIASQVARKHGFQAQGTSQVTYDHVLQSGTSDWEFLHCLADAEGLALTFSAKTLRLEASAQARTQPGSATPRTDAAVLEYGANIQWLRACVTASDQLGEVEVRGWDPRNARAVIGRAAPATRSVSLGASTPEAMSRAIPGGHRPVQAPIPTQAGQANGMAAGLADAIGGSFAELEGVVTGNPALRAGESVTVRGLGEPFDGGYVLTRVTHRFEPDGAGYTTAVEVASAADRTTRGILVGAGNGAGAAGGAGGRGGPRDQSLVVAVVTNNQDPDEAGRVRLKYPTLSDDLESWWTPVVYAGAGKDQGFIMVPQVGDVVLAALPASPLAVGWVIGGLHQKSGTLPLRTDPVKSGTASWVGRTGMAVQLVEKSGEEMIRLSLTHASGDQDAITIAKSAEKGISITSGGPVTITATKDVTIEGQSIEVTGKQKIALKAPEIELKGDTKVSLKGAQLELKADGMAELSSSGITTVKGSLVKIN